MKSRNRKPRISLSGPKGLVLVAAGVMVLTGCTRQVQPEPDIMILESPRATHAYGPEVLTLRSPALEHFSPHPLDYTLPGFNTVGIPAWRACMHGGRFGDRVCRPGWLVPELPQDDNREDPVDDGRALARNELTRLLTPDYEADEITANRYRLHLRQLRFAAHEAGLNDRQIATLMEQRTPQVERRSPGGASASDRRIEELRTSSGNTGNSGTRQAMDRASATRSAGADKGGNARITPVAREFSPD